MDTEFPGECGYLGEDLSLQPRLLPDDLAHFVDVGAHSVETTGTCDDALAFVNPDGTVVLLVRNELTHAQMLQVQLGARSVTVELPPDSIGTLALKQT
jgi:glucosylceramidase